MKTLQKNLADSKRTITELKAQVQSMRDQPETKMPQQQQSIQMIREGTSGYQQ